MVLGKEGSELLFCFGFIQDPDDREVQVSFQGWGSEDLEEQDNVDFKEVSFQRAPRRRLGRVAGKEILRVKGSQQVSMIKSLGRWAWAGW